jgi:hypothetical protein
METRRSFYGALMGLLLAIAASANGFILVPLGLVILALDRHYVRVIWWLGVFAACLTAYRYRYFEASSHSHVHNSLFPTIVHALSFFLYVVAFVGSAAALPLAGLNHRLVVLASLLLGLFMFAFILAMVWRGYARKNPLISYCALFLLLTAIGVAWLRSDRGIAHSLDSRYKIYSALLLIFVWFSVVQEFLRYDPMPLRRNAILLATPRTLISGQSFET